MDFERRLYETEDFLERQLGSRATRELAKRKVKRGMQEVGRRIRRAAFAFVLLLLALIVADVAGASINLVTWIVAIPTLFLVALLTLTMPTRQRAEPVASGAGTGQRLDRLASNTEDWLLERCRDLPRPALPALDSILYNLREMQPCLADLPETSHLHGETERLMGQHLPRLVDSYLALPHEARAPGSENDLRIAQSLDLVAQELHQLCHRVGEERSSGFEINRRFIESRYGDER